MMLLRISATMERIATRRNLILVLFIFFLITLVFFPLWQNQMKVAGAELNPLDLQFGNSPQEVFNILQDYGAEGRRLYAWGEIILDTLFPLAYSFLLSILFSLMLPRLFRENQALRKFNILPFAILLLDYFENAGIVTMLISFPTPMHALATLTSTLTQIKWIIVGLNILLLLAFTFLIIFQSRKLAGKN